MSNFSSVTFGTDNRTVVSNDHAHLNRGIDKSVAMSDSAKANINVATRNSGGLHTFNSHSGVTDVTPAVTSVQLRAPDGKVQVGQYRTDAATVENLKVMAPDMFEAPEVKAQEAAKVAEVAKAEEISKEELGRHADDTLEGYHQHVVGMASTQNLIGLMVYGQKGETPPRVTDSGHRRGDG